MDHEALPDAQLEFVTSTQNNRRLVDYHLKKQGVNSQNRQVTLPGNINLMGGQKTLSQALSSKHNEIRYKVLYHIWVKNRKLIKNQNDKREKIDTTVSFEQFLAEDPKATQ